MAENSSRYCCRLNADSRNMMQGLLSPFSLLTIRFRSILIQLVRGNASKLCIPTVASPSYYVPTPYREYGKDKSKRWWNILLCFVSKSIFFTYVFCLYSRCGRRAAPGQSCRETCQNTGSGRDWNAVAVTTSQQMCCCTSMEKNDQDKTVHEENTITNYNFFF